MRRPAPDVVFTAVADWFGVTAREVAGPSREKHLLAPRRVAALILRDIGYSLATAGRLLGDRDHTSVSHILKGVTSEDADDAAQIRKELDR